MTWTGFPERILFPASEFMKVSESKMFGCDLPYLLLWLLLALFILLSLSSFLFPIQEHASPATVSAYAPGYFIRSNAVGSIRVIPIAGSALKSPVSNTIKAIISPYIEENEALPPTRKIPESY